MGLAARRIHQPSSLVGFLYRLVDAACVAGGLESMQRRVECDHEYTREWSLWLDVKILFRTIFVVLQRQNAY